MMRHYQQAGYNKAFEVWQHAQAVLLQAPTGSGKTYMSANIVARAVDMGLRVWFFVHTDKLLNSTLRDMYKMFETTPAIVQAVTGKVVRPDARIMVMTYQKLRFNWARFEPYFADGNFLAVYDEAHLAFSDFTAVKWRAERKGYILGLTATPRRAQSAKVKLSDIYDYKHVVATPTGLVQEGFLAPLNIVLPAEHIDLSGLEAVPTSSKSGETDFERHALGKFMSQKRQVYSGFERLYNERKPSKVLVFCSDIDHVMSTVEQLHAAGIDAHFVTSKVPMPDADAKLYDEKLEKWRKYNALARSGHASDNAQAKFRQWGKTFAVLVSADMLTTGVDVPDIQVVAIMRPTQSENMYLQMVGRATRPMPNKVAEFWDLAGNYEAHKHPYLDRDYPLHMKAKRKGGGGEGPTKQCPQCGAIVPAGERQCSGLIMASDGAVDGVCGYIFPKQARVPIDTDFTEIEWEALIQQRPGEIERGTNGRKLSDSQIAAQFSTPVAIYEYRIQHNELHPDNPIKFEWALYKIAELHGRDGLMRLALAKGWDVAEFLQDVESYTSITL